MENTRNVAVVLAGGVGQRVGLNTPKQLLKIAGQTVLEHTLRVFESHADIHEIVLMMAPGFLDEATVLVDRNRFGKVRAILEGGASRAETTWRAIQAIEGDGCRLLFHDAVRPLVESRIISECVTALDSYGAVDVAIPSSDTIVVAASSPRGEIVRDIPDRTRLRRGQTPQCFRLEVIREAYRRALADPEFSRQPPTDDCGVVLRYLPDVPIYIVPGSERNLKITYPVDIDIADKLFRLGAATVPAPGPDVHAARLAGRCMVVFGGSYGIGADVSRMAREHGAEVFSFSRSTTGTDIQRAESVEEALGQVYARTGAIDYVVNTAAVLHMGRLAVTEQSTIAETVGINLLGPINIARAAHQYLAKTGGHLLFYTSSSYTRGRADYSLYSSTKAAAVNLTQALADEWALDGIQVNCVNPERTATPMRSRAFGEEPPGTLLSSEAVARYSLDVLVSDLTGQIIDVRLDRDQPLPVPAG
ncbi:bifunctional cytidylyltransferase/SDR family oxidoreductase [Nonomuraea soli]|uniref:2-C-methyl-D-erythritol 4-phosphate cytidylyltransferase n=1 Tax=Nonomuraea soli TaxID=1032476 RepID=A0A7W0CTX7_9ACTN|nr:bifunctional cytidylyltransferase/SDR family oxidoreductase [Nonomuraea soli]MBA2897286.1 2-C-methyl-D-erythritol 4-phosphate cytidylyltransferase [Nonomuraea soli]